MSTRVAPTAHVSSQLNNACWFFVRRTQQQKDRQSILTTSAMSAQRWCRGLRPLANNCRSFQTSSSPAAAVPALSDVQAKAGGFLSNLFGGRPSRSLVPMTEPLPNVNNSFLDSPPSEAPKTELTTLGNGFKVATEATIVRMLHRSAQESHRLAYNALEWKTAVLYCRDQLQLLASMWMLAVCMRSQCRVVSPYMQLVFQKSCANIMS